MPLQRFDIEGDALVVGCLLARLVGVAIEIVEGVAAADDQQSDDQCQTEKRPEVAPFGRRGETRIDQRSVSAVDAGSRQNGNAIANSTRRWISVSFQ